MPRSSYLSLGDVLERERAEQRARFDAAVRRNMTRFREALGDTVLSPKELEALRWLAGLDQTDTLAGLFEKLRKGQCRAA